MLAIAQNENRITIEKMSCSSIFHIPVELEERESQILFQNDSNAISQALEECTSEFLDFETLGRRVFKLSAGMIENIKHDSNGIRSRQVSTGSLQQFCHCRKC